MTTEQKIIRAKVGLLELAKQLGNVSQACKMMGYSRDSFYRFKELCHSALRRAMALLCSRLEPMSATTAPLENTFDLPSGGRACLTLQPRLEPMSAHHGPAREYL